MTRSGRATDKVSVCVYADFNRRILEFVVFVTVGAFVGRHLLQCGMHFQNDVFELSQFLRRFVFCEKSGGNVTAEFVGNGHDSMEFLG